MELFAFNTHRVESKVPGTACVLIVAPEPSGFGIWCLRDQNVDCGTNDENTKADTCTGRRTDSVANSGAQDDASEVCRIVSHKGWQADLIDNVLPAIDGSGTDYLSPYHKDQSDIIDLAVDAVQ